MLQRAEVFGSAETIVWRWVDIGPFCGLHRLTDKRIVTPHHYLTDPDVIERLGLIP